MTDKADCKVDLDDTVRGGLMTVFIDGQPAARMNDNTDIGLIMEGSPTVLLSKEVYRRAWNETEESWVDSLNVQRNSVDTHRALNGYREERAKPRETGGRNIPNKPVHF